jgi:hypothetical protein
MEEVLDQSSSTPESSPVETAPVEQNKQERSFRQSEVNELIKKVRHEEGQKAARLYQEQPQYAESKYGQNRQENQSNPLPESDIRRLAAEEAQRLRNEWVNDAQARNEQENAQRIVKSFWEKISTGKEKYDDFEKVTENIQYAKFPNVVQLLAEHVDNADDVLYELGKNRLKMRDLNGLYEDSPEDAIYEMRRLSDSIKSNQSVSKMRTPNAPLSQQRPSSNLGSEGAMSMKDLKSKYRG